MIIIDRFNYIPKILNITLISGNKKQSYYHTKIMQQ
nr:MAG TPA: hypothetical protein [Caudoviricetes sp.]